MNKLHPQELADLLQCWVVMNKDGRWFGFSEQAPRRCEEVWSHYYSDYNCMEVTHAIDKPNDCPEWDKAIWEPRVRPERGQLCLFSHNKSGLTIEEAHIGYFDIISDGYFCDTIGDSWTYCKPIDSVPSRIDLDAQRSE